jgi:hypothetical protein
MDLPKLKTDFSSVEEAVSYIKEDIAGVFSKVEEITQGFEDEKRRILENRDTILSEKKVVLAKRDELLAELTELKSKLESTQSGSEGLTARFEAESRKLQAKFQKKIDEIQKERDAEKDAAAAAKLEAAALSELSKPNLGLINADHFWRLHGKNIELSESGTLSVKRPDLGEFTVQTIEQYVADVAQRDSEKHLFKPKSGSGNGSTGAGDAPTSTTNNPFMTGNMTEQAILLRQNPRLAARLREEAAG